MHSFGGQQRDRRPLKCGQVIREVIEGFELPGSGILQVINVHSYVGGKLHEVYYWCDICTIRGYEAGICDCCGDKLEFREVAIKE